MKPRRSAGAFALALTLALSLSLTAGLPAAAQDATQLERRRRVLDQRRHRLQAARLLDQATREMMNGVRLAKPEQVAEVKARRDYEARLDSARALLAAQQRITQEKGNQAAAQQATREIESLITAAERRAAEGRLGEARPLLDRAYLTARVSIESLRRGDTLVRSLTFASAKEEYAYEEDRYQTHRMLIQVLVAERGTSPALMQGFVDRAGALREAAEAKAQGGDHAAAVKAMEDATRELVRAIRAAGLYIPG